MVIFLAIIIPFAQIRRPGVIPAKYFFALWKSGRAKYTKLKPGNIFGVEFHGDLHGGQMPEPKGKRHINSDCPCDIELRNAIRHRRGQRSIFYIQVQVVQSILQILAAVLYILPALLFNAQNILQAGVYIAAGNIL